MSEMGNKPSPGNLSERVRSLRLTETSEPGRSGLWWLPWALCVLLIGAAGVLALEAFSPIDDELLKKLAEERGLNLGKGAGPGSERVTVGGLADANLSASDIKLESKGYIVPIRLVQVSPKVSGTVVKLNIEEGKLVEKGFTLAVLEDVEFRADYQHTLGSVRAAEARINELEKYRVDEIDQAKAELDDAVAQFEQTSSKYTRYVSLKQRNAVSPEDFESAESGFLSMKSRVKRLQLAYKMIDKAGPRDAKIAALKAEHQQALADLKKAKWKLGNTRIEAPITGIILSKKAEEGNLVNPSAFSSGLAASLCEMANLYEMEVDLAIAERDISKVFQNQECRIRAEAFGDRFYAGYVSRIMPMGDRGKSSVPVRVMIQFPALDARGQPLPMEKQGEFLRPEMGAIVTFLNRKFLK